MPREATDGRLRPWLAERIFDLRAPLLIFFALTTLFFGWQAAQLKPDASFEKMIPVSHPYIINFLENRGGMRKWKHYREKPPETDMAAE